MPSNLVALVEPSSNGVAAEARVQQAGQDRSRQGEEAEMAANEKGAPSAPSEEAKAKFREALERKKAASHRTAEGTENAGAVHGPETSGQGQRMFRRRAGG